MNYAYNQMSEEPAYVPPEMPPEARVPRRSVLRAAGVALGSVIAPGLLGADASRVSRQRERLNDAQEAVEAIPGEAYDPGINELAMLPVTSLSVAENPRLTELDALGHHTVAYAVTHVEFTATEKATARESMAGYLNRPEDWTGKDREADEAVAGIGRGVEGDYGGHRQKMAEFMGFLRRTDAPVLCFIDGPDAGNDAFPTSEFAPPEDAFLMVTKAGDGELAEDVTLQNPDNTTRIAKQDPRILFAALRRAGVEEIIVGGQYGERPGSSDPACLAETTQLFLAAGFRVRGVPEIIFPSKNIDIDPRDPVDRALYVDTISMAQAQAADDIAR